MERSYRLVESYAVYRDETSALVCDLEAARLRGTFDAFVS
jgi:hypothetical protein